MKWAWLVIHSMPFMAVTRPAPQPASELCVAFESRYHIDRDCECVVYESNGRSRGSFTSVNYPHVLPTNLSCVLYTFIGDLDEIVELTFTQFDLQPPHLNRSCADFVRLYLNLERAEVNDLPTYELCGDLSPRSGGQRVYFSSRRSVIVELHTDSVQTNHTGFMAAYRFLEKAQFDTLGGTRRWDSDCTYDFYSSKTAKAGSFFSPRYPQNYPPLAACQYYFHGAPDERVRISLVSVQLEGTNERCASSADVITVRDGMDVTSPVLAVHCGAVVNQDVHSTGENASLEFLSDATTQRQGFAATFQFVHQRLLATSTTPAPPRGTPGGGGAGEGVWGRGGEEMGKLSETNKLSLLDSPVMINAQETLATPGGPSDKEGGCYQELLSSDKKSGTVTSPRHPKPYPPDETCRYSFRGQGHERVRLTFSALDLHHGLLTANKSPNECEDLDSLTVTAYFKDTPADIGVYCGDRGTQPPPGPLLSSDPRLDLVFVSRNPPTASASATGFEASFEFISDFGIRTGEQNLSIGCSYSFDSRIAQNGSFTSPNFPGPYPRSTDCHYLFFGQDAERVHIAFTHFDVDGVPPGCIEQTDSDYVELSNFNVALTDRKMSRLCGARGEAGTLPAGARPRGSAFVSDTNFFRVTFRSNHVYDATGFRAVYHFGALEDPYAAGSSQLPSSGVSRFSRPHRMTSYLSIVTSYLSFVTSHLSIVTSYLPWMTSRLPRMPLQAAESSAALFLLHQVSRWLRTDLALNCL